MRGAASLGKPAVAALIAAATCLTSVAAQDRGARPLGFTPEEYRAAAAFATRAPADAVAHLEQLRKTDPERRVTLLRAGLASRDPAVARACAVHLDWTELDEQEHARVVRLLRDRYATPGTAVDFDRFRSIVGSDDLRWIYQNPPRPPWNASLAQCFAELHRQARAEHIPMLLALTFHPDREVRNTAWGNIGTITPRTDRHREAIASATLASGSSPGGDPRPPNAPPAFAYTPPGRLPPALRAVLNDDLTRGASSPPWVVRWLLQSEPGDADSPLLIALAGAVETDQIRGVIATWAMRHLSDDTSAQVLAGLAQISDGAGVHSDPRSPLARGALAFRGVDRYVETIHADAAAGDEVAVGCLAAFDPDRAVSAIARLAFDDEASLSGLSTVATSPYELDFTAYRGRAATTSISGVRLAHVALALPGLNTPATARHAADRLLHGPLPTIEDVDALGFIEVAAPGTLDAVLDRMHGDQNTEIQALAAVLSGALHPPNPTWPPGVVETLYDDPDETPQPAELERRFAAFIRTEPREIPYDIWRMRRPEVRAFLHRARAKRSLGLYAYATAQLACMHDASARYETLRAMRSGRYRWIDEVFDDPHLAMLGDDLQRMVPWWLSELESNCCRAAVASNIFDELFGLDLYANGELDTPFACATRWWKRHRGDDFRWSRVAGRYIPVATR